MSRGPRVQGRGSTVEVCRWFGHRSCVLDFWNPKRMKDPEALLPLEQLFVSDREQRSPQRGKHRELVVRPFDRGKRRADGFDLFAVVESLAADEHVRNPAGLQRPDVRLRHVFAETEKAP